MAPLVAIRGADSLMPLGRIVRRKWLCHKPGCRKCERGGHACKTWTLEYYVPGERDARGLAKKTQEATGFTDRDAAEDLLRRRQQQIGLGVPIRLDVSGVRFPDLVELIRTNYLLKRRNVRRLEVSLKHLMSFFQRHAATGITSEEVDRYKLQRQGEGSADASINRELAALKRMFRLALKARRLLSDHVPCIEMLEEHNVRDVLITKAQMGELLKLLRPQARRIAHVTYITGWRAESDVLTRRWDEHVLWERGVLLLHAGEGKAKKERKFPLFPDLREILEEQRAWTDHEEQRLGIRIPFLWHRNGDRLTTYVRHWRTACRRLAVAFPAWHPEGWIRHAMRYSAVENLLAMGVDAVDICEMVGMTMATVKRYHRLSDARLSGVGMKLQAFFGSPGQKVVGFSRG